MVQLFGTALALGLAGLDPTAALIAVAAMVAGATRRAIAAFGLTVMIGAPLFGSILSLTVGTRLVAVDWWVLVPRGRVGAIVMLAIGVVLLGAGILRLVRPTSEHPHPRTVRVGTLAMLGAGGAYVASLLIDPTFIAVTVLAGRSSNPAEAILMQTTWALISQLPLLVLLVAVARVGQRRAVTQFQGWWSRAKPVVRKVVTAALLSVGLLFVLDASWWFGAGHFLLPEPHPRH